MKTLRNYISVYTVVLIALMTTSCKDPVDYEKLSKKKFNTSDFSQYKTEKARQICIKSGIADKNTLTVHCSRTLMAYSDNMDKTVEKNSVEHAKKLCTLGNHHYCAKASIYYLESNSLEEAHVNLSIGCENYHFLSCELLYSNLNRLKKFIKNIFLN